MRSENVSRISRRRRSEPLRGAARLALRLSRGLVIAALALAAQGVFHAPAALAQPAATEDAKRAARELANKGYELYEAGDYTKAIQFFRDAEARFHAPTLLVIQARAHEKIGGLVEAQALYEKVAAEELAADAPKEFVEAQASAKAALEDIGPRIAFVKIVLKGMTADKVKITVDEVEVPAARLLEPIPANPGTRKIAATIGGDDGGRTVFQTVTLKEGVTKQIQLVFRPGGSVTAGELPPSGGGCASCEIGSLGAGDGAPPAVLGAAAAAALTALRRRRKK